MIENIIDGYFVYGLIDPFTNEIRYIGFTGNMKERLEGHCRPSRLKINNHKNNWIKSILIKNKMPTIIELENYDNENNALQAEIELIEYYKFIGCKLTNRTNGGDKGVKYIRTDEIREKISKSATGKKQSEETKKKISQTTMGVKKKPMSDETKNKLSIINTGSKKLEKNVSKTAQNNPNTRLTKEIILKIKELYFSGNYSHKSLGILFNFNAGHICRILNGKVGKYAK